mgnify:CR=1 FL=1
MTDLESLAFRLVDLPSLRKLAVEGLQFEYADKPVNKQNWTDDEKEIVVESKIIAEKNDFFIYYIQTNTDSLKHWKSIAGKIIKEKNGFCLVCSHNPGGFKWVFSSLSKEFSKSFSETRHVPIEIKPSIKPSNNFVEFLDKFDSDKVVVNYDIGNSASLGYDAGEEISAYGERIVNVHVKDRVKGNGTVPLGQGDANFETVFSALKKISYMGPLILQVARDDHLPEAKWAKINRTFVKNYL